jgi:hypothetical protein
MPSALRITLSAVAMHTMRSPFGSLKGLTKREKFGVFVCGKSRPKLRQRWRSLALKTLQKWRFYIEVLSLWHQNFIFSNVPEPGQRFGCCNQRDLPILQTFQNRSLKKLQRKGFAGSGTLVKIAKVGSTKV